MNIVGLMTSYDFEIDELPESLKCTKCKLVAKDACQVSCGCRFCRVCIDDMMTSGEEFCPGDGDDCKNSPLANFISDYRANKNISRLTVKCTNDGCVYKCPLTNIEEHLRKCQRKSVDCPFRGLGCNQGKLAAEEMNGHLQHDNLRHSEILTVMIANINREIETMKQSDEDSKRQIEVMKHELLVKDEQLTMIMDRLIHLENENKSISQDKACLTDQVRLLSEKLEREVDERCENGELDRTRVIGHIDGELATVRAVIDSHVNEWTKAMKVFRDDIQSIIQGTQSREDDICSMKSHLQSIQSSFERGRIDARCEWAIDEDIENTCWYWPGRVGSYFSGAVYRYKYRLASWNDISLTDDSLWIWLYIHSGPHDDQMEWPFEGQVVITVSDKNSRELCKSISQQSRIERPSDTDCSISADFKFLHSELIGAGLNLQHGVRVSCEIVPGALR